jgi:hypothetical protein
MGLRRPWIASSATSETGAALQVSNPAAVPDTFQLLIKPELKKRNCRVAWRSEDRLGVEFL